VSGQTPGWPRGDEDRRRILALGGGGFTTGERSTALDHLVLELTDKRVPRICFLPTASGDTREQILRFHERFEYWPCEPSTLSLFHLGRDRIDPARHLLSQDAIYVGGGSMRNMLAVWREHGLDTVMRRAWESGVVLAGLSAGAMCWFRGGISMSGGRPEAVGGLGFLPASLSVHRDSEPQRLPAYRRAVAGGRLPDGYALDDGVALLFLGKRLAECVSSRPGAGGARVARVGQATLEAALPLRVLDGARPRSPGVPELRLPGSEDEFALQEMRLLRHGRSYER
jgi:dipeptidase E